GAARADGQGPCLEVAAESAIGRRVVGGRQHATARAQTVQTEGGRDALPAEGQLAGRMRRVARREVSTRRIIGVVPSVAWKVQINATARVDVALLESSIVAGRDGDGQEGISRGHSGGYGRNCHEDINRDSGPGSHGR